MSNPFKLILQELLAAHASVHAAIFCDDEGEMVELAIRPGRDVEEFDLRVAGASAALWVQESVRIQSCRTRDIFWSVKATNTIWLIQGVAEHYYVLAIADPQAPTGLLFHFLQSTARSTRAEM